MDYSSAFSQGIALGNLSLSHLTLNNFQRLFSETNYGTWFVNTLEIAVVSTCCSVILIMLTSWVMSRFQFKGRKTGLLTVMILSMFPTFLSMTANLYAVFGIGISRQAHFDGYRVFNRSNPI